MVWIPGGTFWMGSNEFDDAKPVHKVYVDGFWMDKTEVTNAQFEQFVKATGYVTVAEKPPDLAALLKQQPAGTPPPPKENLIPGSLVFAAPSGPVPLDDPLRWWRWTQGASCATPGGPAAT
jgi:formylglycine-generating enzyme required for sulfatase activity